jgi:excisionase family DNA binding protein
MDIGLKRGEGKAMNETRRETMRKVNTSIQPEFMRREDAANYLGVSTRTISNWQALRIIPHVKAGKKCVLYKKSEIDAAMEKMTIR